jgi:hypothetical protein
VTSLREEFFRRYATSPIHVPRLERLLEAYGANGGDDTFIRRFIEWDRRCSDSEAARIVTEILAMLTDGEGRIRQLSEETVEDSINWMAETKSLPIAERATILQARLTTS